MVEQEKLAWYVCCVPEAFLCIDKNGCLVQGAYDRVHCGAACPPAKLACLLELLRPEGGLIVTPVEPSDLQVGATGAPLQLRKAISACTAEMFPSYAFCGCVLMVYIQREAVGI